MDRLGSKAAATRPAARVAEITPASRGGLTLPFSRLLTDPPDILAQRRPSSHAGFAAFAGSSRPSLCPFPSQKCRRGAGCQLRLRGVSRTRRRSPERLERAHAQSQPTPSATSEGPRTPRQALLPTLGKKEGVAVVALALPGKSPPRRPSAAPRPGAGLPGSVGIVPKTLQLAVAPTCVVRAMRCTHVMMHTQKNKNKQNKLEPFPNP